MSTPACEAPLNSRCFVAFKLFSYSVSVALLLTAFAKLYAVAFSPLRIFDQNDPIFLITYRNLMIIAAFAEMAAVTLMQFKRFDLESTAAVAFLGTLFLAYRFARTFFVTDAFCPCLGTLGGTLPFSPRTQSFLLALLAAFMCIGGSCFLIWPPRRLRSVPKICDGQPSGSTQ